MKKYMVYVEIFGKKYKVEVEAYSEEHAEDIVKKRLIFHKVERVQNNQKDFAEEASKIVKDILDILKS